mgnify:FL=1
MDEPCSSRGRTIPRCTTCLERFPIRWTHLMTLKMRKTNILEQLIRRDRIGNCAKAAQVRADDDRGGTALAERREHGACGVTHAVASLCTHGSPRGRARSRMTEKITQQQQGPDRNRGSPRKSIPIQGDNARTPATTPPFPGQTTVSGPRAKVGICCVCRPYHPPAAYNVCIASHGPTISGLVQPATSGSAQP